MGPVLVVVLYELPKHPLEILLVEDEQAIEALAPTGPDEAFRVGVGPRRPHGSAHHAHSLGGEDLVEGGGELLVAVTEEDANRRRPIR